MQDEEAEETGGCAAPYQMCPYVGPYMCPYVGPYMCPYVGPCMCPCMCPYVGYMLYWRTRVRRHWRL